MSQLLKKLMNLSPIFFVFFVLLMNSCNEDKSSNSIIYTSGGKTSEVLVVMSDEVWKSQLGDTIQSVLKEVKPWFAQEEPAFDLFHIQIEAFIDVYQKYHNILIVRINPDLEKNIIKAKSDVYAKPQTVVEIKAKTSKEAMQIFLEHGSQIMDLYHENELSRIGEAYKGLEVDSIGDKLLEKFGFKLVIPRGFYMAVNKADFAWLRKVTPDIEEGILIYTQPYNSTSDFDPDTIISRRNQLTRLFVPGPLDSTWMKVSSVFPPFSAETTFKGNYAELVRSWWDVQNFPMGGPFLSYTFVDTVANRLITLDGFIKAPKKNKRDLLLHVETIINSFQMQAVEKEI